MIKLRNIEKCFKTKAGFAYVLRQITSERQALLSPKNPPNLPVLDADVDDQVPAAAPDVISRTIAKAPANLVRAAVLRGRDQTAFEFDTFSPSPVIGGGHRPGQRHCQLIFQNCPVKHLCHRAFQSGLPENSLGVAQFTDAAVRRNKINEAGRNDKLAGIMGGLEVAVIAHRAPIRFTRFLEVVRADVGVRVKGSDDLQTLGPAPRMGRHFDGAALASRPPEHAHCPGGMLDDESPFFMGSRRPRLRFPPGEFQRRAYGCAPENGFDAFHESESSSTNAEPPQAGFASRWRRCE